MFAIVKECSGCNKVVTRGNALQVCSAYPKPQARHRFCRCSLHSVPVHKTSKVRRVNPLKASKRQ